MKLSLALFAPLLITGFVAAGTEKAGAVVYCQYVQYPAGCISLKLGLGDAPDTFGGFVHSKSRPLIQINGQVGTLI